MNKTTSFIGFLLCTLALALNLAAQERLRGFTAEGTKKQQEIEKSYVAIPDAEAIREWHRYFTSEPHPATSPRTEEIARYIADTWRKQGLENVVIHRYDVLSSNPRTIQAEMVAPSHYVPSLREDPYAEDPDTANPAVSGAWISFSASGEVTAPVVYANSGNPADYDLLRQQGIDPRGKIVVVRYSNPYSYRGFKALTAQREGAAAMIVYSDPAEDGFVQGDVYPDGPWGPPSHLQRGGIAYDYIVPGDPLTPGWASTEGAHRIPVEEAVSVPKIMALAMSYRDMQPILEKLGGPRAPETWQGGLPIDYRLGGEDVRLHLKIDMDTSIRPNYVIEGRIRGEELPDDWIVLGNHHDAWVFGGVDPSSGTASMMEMTKAFGELKARGIRPRRTLVFCSWDGEEVTLTGSTEWGEDFAKDSREEGRRVSQRRLLELRLGFVRRGRGLARADVRRGDEGDRGPEGWKPLREVAHPASLGRACGRIAPRRSPGAHPDRERDGPHGFPQLPWPAGRGHDLRRALRGLPLDVRRPLLGESHR